MARLRAIGTWTALTAALVVPAGVAASSPLLAWRDPIYITASFAGILGLWLLLVQPLLIGGHLPGVAKRPARRLHAWAGAGLVAAVIAHIIGLWITSPPDVVDVLLFRSPTPFSVWGAVAMWATFAAACLAAMRRRLRLHPHIWRLWHSSLAVLIVIGTVVHAMLIEGAMGTWSKAALCTLALAAVFAVLVRLRPWAGLQRRRV